MALKWKSKSLDSMIPCRCRWLVTGFGIQHHTAGAKHPGLLGLLIDSLKVGLNLGMQNRCAVTLKVDQRMKGVPSDQMVRVTGVTAMPLGPMRGLRRVVEMDLVFQSL